MRLKLTWYGNVCRERVYILDEDVREEGKEGKEMKVNLFLKDGKHLYFDEVDDTDIDEGKLYIWVTQEEVGETEEFVYRIKDIKKAIASYALGNTDVEYTLV